jgi:hypothetical protein
VGSNGRKDLHLLCYQHHQKMLPRLRSESKEPLLYICRKADCLIRYDSSTGYFIDTPDKKALQQEILPRVSCPSDERPMYLAKAQGERRSFRLWKCPECGAARTNEELSKGLGKKMGA